MFELEHNGTIGQYCKLILPEMTSLVLITVALRWVDVVLLLVSGETSRTVRLFFFTFLTSTGSPRRAWTDSRLEDTSSAGFGFCLTGRFQFMY